MIYVTSDWHGCAPETLQALFARAGFSKRDFCFVLGDVIDRGDHGVALLEWLMLQENVELLLGNHEAMLLANRFLFEEITEESVDALDGDRMAVLSEWLENGGEATVAALSARSPEQRAALVEYLAERPLYDVVEAGGRRFFLSHSGLSRFDKGKALADYEPEDFLWNRPQLTDRYFDHTLSVFGHTPTGLFGAEHRGRIVKTDTWIDVDVGVTAGYPPALLRLDDLQEFYAG